VPSPDRLIGARFCRFPCNDYFEIILSVSTPEIRFSGIFISLYSIEAKP